MHSFEITIQRQSGAAYPVIAEEQQGGGKLPVRAEGELALDRDDLLALEIDPAAYGQRLGAALFHGAIHWAFIEALARAEERLHVLLFVEDTALRGLRWERLYAPIDGAWRVLATQQRAPFSRYLPSLTDRRFPPIGRSDLRALIVAASPAPDNRYQLEPFDVAASTAGVRAALGPIPATLLADIAGANGRPTLDEICAQISAEPHTLLHIVCHGRVLKDGETVLFLAGADGPGSVEPVTGTRLIERLGGLEGARGLPHFALLSTCESASPDADEAMGGLGQRLVRELGMPAVLAMTDKISIVTANALSAQIYLRLREHGEPDRALVEATVRLVERGDITVPALFSRLGGRPLFSDSLGRELTAAELRGGLDALAGLLPARAPVLAGPYGQAATLLRRSLDRSAETLGSAARQQRDAAMAEVTAICTEALDMSFPSLCLGQAPPPYDDRCPFPGLRSFQADLRDFFFGREALVQRLARRLDDAPFLAVLGPSGSGKSSLVFAGLIPDLLARRPELSYVSLTPGELPLASLLFALEQARGGQPAPPGDGGPPRLAGVLVVDQFEEVFTLCHDADERRAFFDELLRQAGAYLVLITMRADFLGEVAPYAALRERVTAYQELIAPMTPEELRRAMELQAAAVGLRFEADLSGQILDDVRGEPGAMPLLQHALQELWQRRRGYWLRAAEYHNIGGIQRAIAFSADQIYEQCGPDDRERVRGIFVRLTRLDGGQGEGAQRDTRQRVALPDLVTAGAALEPIRALVVRLADARLLVTGVGPAGEETVEVAHEALIRGWPRLRAWLGEDRQGLLLRDTIGRAAREWEASGADEGLLFRGNRLDESLALARTPRFALNSQEQGFLDAAVALRDREAAEKEAARQRELKAAQDLAAEQQRRADEARATAGLLRQRALISAAVAVFAAIAAVAALGFWGQANVQQGRSLESAERAETAAALAEGARNEAQIQQQTAETAKDESQAQQQTAVAAKDEADASRQTAQDKALLAAAQSAKSDGDLSLAIYLGREIAGRLADDAQAARFLSEVAYAPGVRRQITLDPQLFPASALAFALSPDGRLVALGDDDGTVGIWNLDDGGLASHTTLDGSVVSLAFSPDGGGLAVARSEGDLVIQSLSGERHFGGSDYTAHILSLVYSPDSTRLAVLIRGGHIDIWDTASLQIITGLDSRTPITSLAFSPARPELLTGNFDGTATLWDLSRRAEIVRFDGGTSSGSRGENGERLRHSDRVTAVAFSPDGALAITGSIDKTIGLWDVGRRAPAALGFLAGHTATINSVEFSPDGQQILSSSDDGTMRLWSLLGLRELQRLEVDVYGVLAASFRPRSDGAQAVTMNYDDRIRLWDLTDGREVKRSYAPGSADSVALSGDASLALVASTEGVQSIDISTTQVLQSLTLSKPALPAVAALSRDGSIAAVGGSDGTITLWNPRSGATVGILSGHSDQILSLAFDADGTRLASGSRDKTMRIWDVAGQSLAQTIPLANAADPNLPVFLYAVAWSPDGSMLLLGTSEGLRLWDVATGASRQETLWSHVATLAVAWSPDGTLAAAGGADRDASVIDVASGEVLHNFAHRGTVQGLAFSADGTQVISAATDRRITLWSLASASEVQHIDVADGSILSLVAAGAADIILTGSDDGAVRIWRFDELGGLSGWIDANRYVPELSEQERADLSIQ